MLKSDSGNKTIYAIQHLVPIYTEILIISYAYKIKMHMCRSKNFQNKSNYMHVQDLFFIITVIAFF